jgi:hypothetical protein
MAQSDRNLVFHSGAKAYLPRQFRQAMLKRDMPAGRFVDRVEGYEGDTIYLFIWVVVAPSRKSVDHTGDSRSCRRRRTENHCDEWQ